MGRLMECGLCLAHWLIYSVCFLTKLLDKKLDEQEWLVPKWEVCVELNLHDSLGSSFWAIFIQICYGTMGDLQGNIFSTIFSR